MSSSVTSKILRGAWSKSEIESPDTMLKVFPQLGHSSSSPSTSASLKSDLSPQLQLPCDAKKPDSILKIAYLIYSCSKFSTDPISKSSTSPIRIGSISSFI